MTETDESELEDTAVRDNRPYETNNIYNYSEGIIPRTYTPPLKEKRGRKYASPRKYEMDTEDYFSDTSDEEWPTHEQLITPCMAADNVNRAVRNRNNNHGRCAWSRSENDITSDEICNHIDRSFTRLATAGAGIKDDNFSVNDVKCGKIPATKLIPVGVLDTEKQLIMRVSMITSELSEVETIAYSETDINEPPAIKLCVCPERRRREEISVYVDTQLIISLSTGNYGLLLQCVWNDRPFQPIGNRLVLELC